MVLLAAGQNSQAGSIARLVYDGITGATVSTLTNVLNYHVGTVDVIQATLGADGRTVTLQTAPLVRGQSYLVAVINLRDASVAGNPANATGSFVAEVDYSGEILADAPVRYWRFNEATGMTVASLAKGLDTLAGAAGTLVNSPKTGVVGLLAGDPADHAIEFTAASSQRVTVPNGSDLNATAGPWAKRTIELWFRAASVPAPDATGLAATAALWEEGAAARNVAVYLWRDPANPDSAQAELIFHALNNATDGPGAPFGLTTQPAVLARHTVTVGETYHVVAVLDGDKTGFTGSLVLYVNGTEVSRTGGIGQIYNHTGDVQIGRGNGLIHTGENGDLGFFDGVIDEVAVYNLALSAARVTAHYQAGQGGGGANGQAPALAQIETRGNPNRVLATFTRPLAGAAATNLGNYVLQTSAGTPLPIAGAVLLPGELTVQLEGAFGFQAGATYTLTVRDLTDRGEPPLVLSPNPTRADFQFTAGGAVGIGSASELASQQVLENESVRLAVVPTGSAPFAYQWFRNGGPLAGEMGPQLSVTVTAATVGEYTVEVRNDFSVATSPPALLSLDVDQAPPQLTGITALAGSLNQVRLTFDEPVDPQSATNLANYQVVGVLLQTATLDATGRGLTLHTGPLVLDQRYTLTLSGVRDRAAAGNALTTTTEFVPAVSYVDEVLADHPVRYWRLDGTNGATTASLVSQQDSAATAAANLANAPEFGVAGLVPNVPSATAVRLTATNSQRLLVPNGSDLNANVGPWAKRSVQFWFQADRVPAPGTTGLAATAGLWEEGGANRTLTVYLWRDPANANADEVDLILNAVNNLADGPGSPFGPPENPAVFARARVRVGEVYHVVAVFDGDATGFNGSLVLYLNGAEAGRAAGVGQLYNHTSDIQIGRGNARTHANDNGDFGFFDGLIDEVSVFNTALSADRVAQLYQFARTAPATVARGRISSIAVQPGKLVIAWTGPGRLGVADSLAGPYIPVADAANPHTESLTGSQQRFFQVLP